MFSREVGENVESHERSYIWTDMIDHRSYTHNLKGLWSEICFCLVLKFTFSNTRFQSLRRLELKRTILQAFKVEHFASQKWSGEWVELIQK